jgi:transcriptional regulator with XRE-family HTH domain
MHATAHAYAVTSRLQGETTGDRIREARQRAGISRQQLADMVGVAYISAYQWERGKYAPSSDNLNKIASVCGVMPHELSGWDAVSAAHGAPASLERFLETAEGATVTEAEHSALVSMPWDREPTTLSYHYALQAIRAQQSRSEAVASAEETEAMLTRGLARGRRMLGDEKKEPAQRPGPRKR